MSATHIDVVTVGGDGSPNHDGDPMGQAEAEAAASEARQAAVAVAPTVSEPLGPRVPQRPMGRVDNVGPMDLDDEASPRFAVATAAAPMVAAAAPATAAAAEPAELRDRVVSSDTWTRDEPRFRDLSHPSVFVPAVEDRIRTQAEILALESGEAVRYIEEQHALCFGGGDMDPVARAYRVSEVDENLIKQADATTIDNIFKEKVEWMLKAMSAVQKDPAMAVERKVEIFTAARTLDAMYLTSNGVLSAINKMMQCAQASLAGQMGSDAEATWRYMPVGSDETENALQRMYRIAFDEANRLGYARYKDSFMRRVTTSDGFVTNAWEVVKPIRDFVYDLTSQPNGMIQFLAKRAANIMDNVAELLTKTQEPTVPWLKIDRHVFAFRNGCYLAKDELFVRFNRSGPPMLPNGKPCPTACEFHNCELDERWLDAPDWRDIPTPTVDFIMNTQKLSEDVKRTYCAMLGRSLYDLGEMDNWQVLLYIKGQAETGKSTLLNFVRSFYNPADVGTLASNIEDKFGASMLAKKFVVIGDDLQEDFSLNQQLFNNFATGTDVSLPVKNAKFALTLKWVTPLLLSGNVLPGYKDNSGAFSRRLLIIYYGIPVIHVDPTLPARLDLEKAAAIVKFNRAYRTLVRRLEYLLTRPVAEGGPLTFWEAIPEDFRVQKRNVMQSSNSFMSFFHSGQLVFGPTLYMPRQMFVNTLMQYCQSNSINRPAFRPSSYEGPFGIMGLRMSVRQTLVYPRTEGGKSLTEQWVIGCDVPTGEVLAAANADHVRAAERAQQAYLAADDAPAAAAPAHAGATARRKRTVSEVTTAAAAAAAPQAPAAHTAAAAAAARAPGQSPAEKRQRF